MSSHITQNKYNISKQLQIFCNRKQILFPVQSKIIIFNHYTVTKKKWRNMQNIIIMGDKLYQISSPVYIFS